MKLICFSLYGQVLCAICITSLKEATSMTICFLRVTLAAFSTPCTLDLRLFFLDQVVNGYLPGCRMYYQFTSRFFSRCSLELFLVWSSTFGQICNNFPCAQCRFLFLLSGKSSVCCVVASFCGQKAYTGTDWLPVHALARPDGMHCLVSDLGREHHDRIHVNDCIGQWHSYLCWKPKMDVAAGLWRTCYFL